MGMHRERLISHQTYSFMLSPLLIRYISELNEQRLLDTHLSGKKPHYSPRTGVLYLRF